MINWKEVAEQNNLSIEDFKKEIFMAAACIGAMSLDENQIEDCLKFTCSDDIGPLELYIRRSN